MAETILAHACENESNNAKRMRIGLEPLPAHSVIDFTLLYSLFQFAIANSQFNPLKPNSSNYYALSYRLNLPFLISDIRTLALSPECQSARMSEIKNGRLTLYMVLNIRSVTIW